MDTFLRVQKTPESLMPPKPCFSTHSAHSYLHIACTLQIETQAQGNVCTFFLGGGTFHPLLTCCPMVLECPPFKAFWHLAAVQMGTTGYSQSRNNFFTTFSGPQWLSEQQVFPRFRSFGTLLCPKLLQDLELETSKLTDVSSNNQHNILSWLTLSFMAENGK